MAKILVYSPPGDHTHSTENIELFSGINLRVVFSNTARFGFTQSAQKADIVCIAVHELGTHIDNVPEQAITEIENFCEPFAKNVLYLDIGHMMHMGEGHSDISHLMELADIHTWCFAKHNNRFAMVSTNLASLTLTLPESLLYTDFLWNRHQVFYAHQPDTVFTAGEDLMHGSHWYPRNFDASVYELSDLDDICSDQYINNILTTTTDNLPRLFVAPCMTRGAPALRRELTGYANANQNISTDAVRDFLRTQLITLLRNYPGYIGDPSTGNFLVGQGQDAERLLDQLTISGPLGWTPIHNAYYDNTVLSIYTETLTMTTKLHGYLEQTMGLTEKTWEPLIKGHFILPFGYHNMVGNLVEFYDVMLPDWIDYTYDTVDNDLERWYEYNKEVKRVLAMGAHELFWHKHHDKHILKHNRNLLMQGGYRDTMDSALQLFCRNKPGLSRLRF